MPADENRIRDESGLQNKNPYGEASLLCSILMIFVAAIGVLTNLTTVRIFTHRPLVSSINTLLAGLALVDAALLLSAVPLYSSAALYSYATSISYTSVLSLRLENAVAYMCVYVYPLTSMFQTASVWTMVVITIERYVAVCHPFAARTACTWRRAVMALIVVGLSSVLYNVSRFWEYELKLKNLSENEDETDNLETATPADPEAEQTTMFEAALLLRGDRNYMTIYVHWLYFIFIFALPFAVLVLLNTMVVIVIRRANQFRATLTRRQCKEHATATMMVIVAVVFLACNCLAFILNAMDVFGFSTVDLQFSPDQNSPLQNQSSTDQEEEQTEETPVYKPLFYFLIDLNNLLVMVHCSSNFFIYLIFSKRYRHFFCLLSPCCYFRQRRLGDLKNGSVFERDPLSTVSVKNRQRSCVVSNHPENTTTYELELVVQQTTPITPLTESKMKNTFSNGKSKKKRSVSATDAAEALINNQNGNTDYLTVE